VEVVRLGARVYFRQAWLAWLGVEPWLVSTGLVLVVLFIIARVYQDTFGVRAQVKEHRVAGLPEGLEGLRIVPISDVQADARTDQTRLEAYIDVVNGQEADIVLFSGDLVTWGDEFIPAGAAALGKI